MSTPVYLLAGGNRGAKGPYRKVLADAFADSGSPHPAVACIGAANGDNPEFFEWTAKFLRDAGAASVELAPLVPPNGNVHAACELLTKADVVFIAGGDVEEGMFAINVHQLAPFLHNLHRQGSVFCGMSAGAIMLARQWIRWTNPDDDNSTQLFDCLGITPILCDVHSEDDGWDELGTLLRLAGNGLTAYGIPSGGAARAWHDGRIEPLCSPIHVLQAADNDKTRAIGVLPPLYGKGIKPGAKKHDK